MEDIDPEVGLKLSKKVKEEKEDLPFVLLVLHFDICRNCIVCIPFNLFFLCKFYV